MVGRITAVGFFGDGGGARVGVGVGAGLIVIEAIEDVKNVNSSIITEL